MGEPEIGLEEPYERSPYLELSSLLRLADLAQAAGDRVLVESLIDAIFDGFAGQRGK